MDWLTFCGRNLKRNRSFASTTLLEYRFAVLLFQYLNFYFFLEFNCAKMKIQGRKKIFYSDLFKILSF